MEHLYKYKSLKDLYYFIDILLNKRLYAAKYLELNDPLEGYISSYCGNKDVYDQRANTRICSLSTDYKNILMWSHYADSHKGCCIELSITSSSWKMYNVKYVNHLPNIDENSQVDDILTTKLKFWEYENEVRFLKKIDLNREKKNKNGRRGCFIHIKIHKIYLGAKINKEKESLIKGLVYKIDPKIKVEKVLLSELTI